MRRRLPIKLNAPLFAPCRVWIVNRRRLGDLQCHAGERRRNLSGHAAGDREPRAVETMGEFRRRLCLAALGLAEIERIERSERPTEVGKLIRSPWPSPRYAELLYTMTWRVVVSNSEKFITSDNPTHFFEDYGIGRPESEVYFPLAPDVGLHMSRHGAPGELSFPPGRSAIVKELNARVATGAVRFVFSAGPARWLGKVCEKRNRSPNRIQW